MNNYRSSEPALIKMLNKIVRSVEHKFVRDFFEIEHLQKSRNLPFRFVDNVRKFLQENLIDNISYYYPKFGIIYNDTELAKATDPNLTTIIVNSLEEEINFTRSLPFCSISFAVREDNKTIASLVSFPVLNLTYYAHKDSETFANNQRLRISDNIDKAAAMISSNLNLDEHKDFSNVNFNSLNYEACLVASGKIDFLAKNYASMNNLYAIMFILEKAGFKFEVDEDNNNFITSNKKFKNLFEDISDSNEAEKEFKAFSKPNKKAVNFEEIEND